MVERYRQTPGSDFPRYRSNKIVWALKIKGIRPEFDTDPLTGEKRKSAFCMWLDIDTEEEDHKAVLCTMKFANEQMPQIGGYVVIGDGIDWKFMRAEEFEEAYSRIIERPI